jgi:hypothetical protein
MEVDEVNLGKVTVKQIHKDKTEGTTHCSPTTLPSILSALLIELQLGVQLVAWHFHFWDFCNTNFELKTTEICSHSYRGSKFKIKMEQGYTASKSSWGRSFFTPSSFRGLLVTISLLQ